MNRPSLWSRLARGGFVSLLSLALLLPFTGRGAEILINEIMAANTTIAPLGGSPYNLTNYHPDFVELYNASGRTIDLAAEQWTLSNKKNPFPSDFKDWFFFPAGTVLAPDSYLLVFFDNNTNYPGIHTTFTEGGTNITFTLQATGDRIQLYQGKTSLVDSNIFGIQVQNYSIGRIPDGSSNPPGAFTLNYPTPCGGTVPCVPNSPAPFTTPAAVSNQMTLKINEWLALSSGGTNINRDWFEVYNPDSNNIVLLSGLVFADEGTTNSISLPGLRAVPPLTFIAPLDFVQIFCLGSGQGDADDADEVDFSLSSSNGDGIFIYAPDRSTVIDMVHFGALPTANVSRGRLPDGTDNIEILPRLSPLEKNFGAITEIVINEVLTHTDPPLEDAIELYNPTTTNVNVGYWWISNDREEPRKFQIPGGTIVPPGGYVVFYEMPGKAGGFNRNGRDTGTSFTLNSARGDSVWLFKGRADGSLTGDRRGIDFGPSENGVSFGRYITIAETNVDIVAMSERTFGTDNPASVTQFRTGTGKTNSYPKVGPIVINEIHYHPPGVGDVDNNLDEFIEIRNIADTPTPLFDPGFPTNQWRLRDAVDFEFPTNNVTLAVDEFALIVNFDPNTNAAQLAIFRAKFPEIPAGTKIYGPYRGDLGNSGETVELQKPDHPQAPGRVDAGLVPYFVVDRVKYNDKAPWPTNADGLGFSLQRKVQQDYGNDLINWKEAAPTPGRFNNAIGVEAPRITVQPKSQTNSALLNTSLSVTSRGSAHRFQWTFHGTNLPNATNATLAFIGLSADNAGPYQVVLSNIAGSVTSVVATLTVNPSPADLVVPTVTITTPAANARLNDASVTLKGTATDKVALNRVEYSVGNGAPFLTATGTTLWGAQIALQPGTNILSARSIDTSSNASPTKVISVFRVVTGALGLATNGLGAVAGATNGQLLEIGRGYSLTATPGPGQVFSNWTGGLSSASPKLDFLMAAGLSLTANFVPNPFSNVAGKFNGLFYETNQSGGVLHGSSGFFTLTVTDRGTYTASLLSGGFKLAASGQLDLEGKATNNIILRKGTNALTVTWAVALDGSDTLTGTVSDLTAGWTADLNGDRAVFSKTRPCENAGKYTLLLPGLPHDMSVPGGHSYGTVSIDSNGVVSLKGYLSDKTSAAQKVPLSKNGQWPLYVPLYSGKGSLLSWVAFTDRPTDDFHGLLNWSKPALSTAKYYPLGFNTNDNEVVGSRYAPPVGTNKILQMTGGLLSFTGGNLVQDQTNSVILGLSSKVTNNSAPAKLSMSFTLSSGLFKGSYTPTNAGAKAVSFAGAVLQKGTNAAGYYLGTNQSGRVVLEPAP